jgi:predicted nucleic-acid-binding protein
MQFLTTDIFLSFLTETNTPRAEAARAVLRVVESGTGKITTSSIVLYELITVLHDAAGYHQPKERVVDTLTSLLGLRGFYVEDKQVWIDALTLWQRQPIELTDAYNSAYARHHGISTLSPTAKHASR